MRLKATRFRELFSTSGIRNVYPKNRPSAQPHVTIEPGDAQTEGNPVTGEKVITKVHYTEGKWHLGFTEVDGKWTCDDESGGFVPTPKKQAIARAKQLVKKCIEECGGEVAW